MLWSVFSISNEILVVQGFTTSFRCLLTKKQGPWGRFCSQIFPWKLAGCTLVRFFPKGDAAQLIWALNLGTLFKLVYRLLRNSAEKEADSSSSHPERGCQETAEEAEITSIQPDYRDTQSSNPSLCSVSISDSQCPSSPDSNDSSKIPTPFLQSPQQSKHAVRAGSRATQPQELGYITIWGDP